MVTAPTEAAAKTEEEAAAVVAVAAPEEPEAKVVAAVVAARELLQQQLSPGVLVERPALAAAQDPQRKDLSLPAEGQVQQLLVEPPAQEAPVAEA